MMLTEEVLVDEQGVVHSPGTWEYKPPCSKTIPVDFRVTLVSEPEGPAHLGPAGVDSSKAVGEPAFVLASSAFFAVKRAIVAARRDRGVNDWCALTPPASPGAVQTACLVDRNALVMGDGRS